MEIQYHGANAVRITTKKSQIVVDPQSDIANLDTDVKKAGIIVATQPQFKGEKTADAFVIDGPGEYEFEDISIKGVAVQAATAAAGDVSATMYRISHQGVDILSTGHINEKDAELHLEEIGTVDILIIPVGGSGYTLDSVDAANLVRAVEPKMVIPVHYSEAGIAYDIPQQELEMFTKELGTSTEEAVDKLKVKSMPEQLTVQPLIRQ